MQRKTWSQIKQEIQVHIDSRREQERASQCQHQQTRMIRSENAGGAISARRQCVRCSFILGGAVKKAEVPNFDSLPLVGYEEGRAAAKRYWDGMSALWGNDQEILNKAFWNLYNEHMRSQFWFKKRAKVLRRANGICEGCGERPPEHIHHTTYEHLGDELLFELVAICAECHQKIHPHRELSNADSCPF